MKVCHLTTTHPPDDARIAREGNTLCRCGHRVTVATIPPRYPKWQHPLKLLQLAAESLRHDADIYHCHEPDALTIGLLHKLRGKQVVYDVHEHWPSELPHDIGAPQTLAPFIDPVERWLARRADAVIAVSESVGARFDRPVILPNYPDPATTLLPPPATLDLHAFSCIAAKLHTFHGVPEALAAVDRLRARGWEDARLTLIGNRAVSVPAGAPVTCTGYIPQAQVPAALQTAGVGLVLLQPEYENIRIGLPNKLFASMAAGVPVIASALPEIQRVVENARCGLLVPPGDVDGIVDAAIWLADHPNAARAMGSNGQAAIRDRYHWSAVEGRLIRLYGEVAEVDISKDASPVRVTSSTRSNLEEHT